VAVAPHRFEAFGARRVMDRADQGTGPVDASVGRTGVDLDIQGGRRARGRGPQARLESDCLSEDEVLAFVAGSLDIAEIALVDAHAALCTRCSDWVLEVLRICEGQCIEAANADGCLAFEPGVVVSNRYLIARRLGHGGMGDLYAARDLERRTMVALKTVKASGCDDPRANRRLLAEHEIARRIRHENVCRSHAASTHRARQPKGAEMTFIVMDLIEGESLASRLQRGPLSLDDVERLAQQLLSGLAAIHRSRVIHRDIKSHNVMLHQSGPSLRASIIDFGLSIRVGAQRNPRASAAGGAASGVGSFGVASSGVAFEGSPPYMAPEQFLGQPVTPAADVFAAGVVLFEALTGTLPFRRLRDGSRGAGCATELAPRVRELRETPPALDDFIARCLHPDPQRRFRDGVCACRALDPCASLAS
jgi:eukaryotic-like serine/threonine-protein kinase